MSRPIKFRVWDGHKMHYPTNFEFGISGVNGKASIAFVPFGSLGYCTTAHIQQYTGLEDSKGKEIYEGDIVRYGLEDEIVSSVIEYAKDAHDSETCPYGSGFVYRVISSKEYPENDDSDYSPEVIGNIYEHPELLEAKQ